MYNYLITEAFCILIFWQRMEFFKEPEQVVCTYDIHIFPMYLLYNYSSYEFFLIYDMHVLIIVAYYMYVLKLVGFQIGLYLLLTGFTRGPPNLTLTVGDTGIVLSCETDAPGLAIQWIHTLNGKELERIDSFMDRVL